jgi:predicted regulator of amino acid metabolism with ACT domain
MPKSVSNAFNKLKQREIANLLSVLQLGSGLVLVPEQARFRELCDRVARVFASHGIEVRDILQTLPATRERVFARHYLDLTAQKPTRKRPTRK